MALFLPRGLPARQTRFLCLLAARLVLSFSGTRTRRYALSPLTLLPPTDSGPGSGPYLGRSPAQEPPPIGITIDPISLQRH